MATVKTTPIILPGIVKNIELNGCWSEPVLFSDDRHRALFAFRERFHSYARAYCIAKLNRQRLEIQI